MSTPPRPAAGARLSGWKAIADYLGVSVRTAQMWEKRSKNPLPVIVTDTGRIEADVAAVNAFDLQRRRERTPDRRGGKAA